MRQTLKWWQQAVFYQIYPRSFADGNGDGIGDFVGMTDKLDYLQALGVDAIWLSPHFPSPFLDCGYDISDYTGVAPEYGTREDFVTFLREAHARNLRVILDLVLNHTSDQHPWFMESRSSRDNPKRDWYIWRDGKHNALPNNWASIFGGSAWTDDAQTEQYYYHVFLAEQPDLNWRNPQVKQAMWDAVRYWLDLGVDGFRLDAIATIYEHPELPDHTFPIAPEQLLDANMLTMEQYGIVMQHQTQQPGLHELMQELRALTDEYPGDRVLVGEDELVAFHGTGDDELHLVFNFPLMRTKKITPAHIRANQEMRFAELPSGAWACNTLGNHDTPRVKTYYGDGTHDTELARLHAALLLTLMGTPFLYNGEEIGMTDLELTALHQIRDTSALKRYHMQTTQLGKSPEKALQASMATTRDRCRSPFQWNNTPNAGFCPSGVQPWLPVNSNHADGISVAAQEHDDSSMLNFYRRLLHLRRNTPALRGGEYQAIDTDSDAYLAFLRRDACAKQTCLVVLNFSDATQVVPLKDSGVRNINLLFSTEPRPAHTLSPAPLRVAPFEILIVEIR